MGIRPSLQSFFITITLLAIGSLAAQTADESEIEYLLTTIGVSSCTFNRNGTEHSSLQAEKHLRMKYGKAHKHINSAEDFIHKLATASSWTGKPYLITCPDSPATPSGLWLEQQLSQYRLANFDPSP